MMKNCTNKSIKIIFENTKLNLPQDILNKIKENWKKIEQEKSNVWNGEVICVTDIKEDDNTIELYCQKSDYAHYLYGERIGLPLEYCCRNLSAGCLLETSDGYFMIGELDETTSYPRMLQVSGGNIDRKDINENNIDIMQTIIRETKEEVNIDLNNKEQVESYKIRSMYIAEENEQQGIQVFATAKLNMNSVEMKRHFDKYYKYLENNGLEKEFRTIYFIHKENGIEEFKKMTNPKRDYLLPLLEMNSK